MSTSIVSNPLSADAPSPTAAIIPFPVRKQASAPTAAAGPEQRLARALGTLNAAMADQRTAVVAWRDVLTELKTTTGRLDDNLHRYRASLRTLGNSVAALRSQTRSLEAWADEALARQD